MDIKFHCDALRSFPDVTCPIRAFLYSDYSIPLHSHDFYEMNIIFGGNGMHQIENNRFSVKAGDVFVIPPMVAHAYYDTEALDVYHLLFKKEFMNEIAGESASVPGFMSLVEIEPYLRCRLADNSFLHLSDARLTDIKAELRTIQDGGEYDNAALAPLKKHGTAKLLYELSYCLHTQLGEPSRPRRGKYDGAVIAALEYIHLNYQSRITVEDLCSVTYLSRSTLLRFFSDVCGCSPSEYLKKYRVAKARELLAAGVCSKSEIAYKCGFYDLSHMERTLNRE